MSSLAATEECYVYEIEADLSRLLVALQQTTGAAVDERDGVAAARGDHVGRLLRHTRVGLELAAPDLGGGVGRVVLAVALAQRLSVAEVTAQEVLRVVVLALGLERG